MRCSVLAARLGCLVFGLSITAIVGCGPSTAKLSGTVTYHGTALKGGSVTFIPIGSGQTFTTSIEPDGTYAFEQIRTGNYKVCVDTASLKSGGSSSGAQGHYGGKTGAAASAGQKSKIKNTPPPDAKVPEGYRTVDPFSGAEEAAKRYVPIPPEYGKPDTTKLTFEIKGGIQQYNISLD